VVDENIYSGVPTGYILSNLLSQYPCGITVGTFVPEPTPVSSYLDTVSLLAAIQTVVALVDYAFRVNDDLTLDYAPEFGEQTDVVFTEGVNLQTPKLTQDLSIVLNQMHVRGHGLINNRSTGVDAASALEFGPQEGTDLQQTLVDYATIVVLAETDAAANAALSVAISVEVTDENPPGTFDIGDAITVNSPTLGLSGYHQVQQIIRKFTDPYYAQLQLGSVPTEFYALENKLRSLVDDLPAAATVVDTGLPPPIPGTKQIDMVIEAPPPWAYGATIPTEVPYEGGYLSFSWALKGLPITARGTGIMQSLAVQETQGVPCRIGIYSGWNGSQFTGLLWQGNITASTPTNGNGWWVMPVTLPYAIGKTYYILMIPAVDIPYSSPPFYDYGPLPDPSPGMLNQNPGNWCPSIAVTYVLS
jgi:hypothetical protein